MKKILTFLLTLLVSAVLFGQIGGHDKGTSYTDILGTTHYNLNNGHSGTSYKDILGNTQFNSNNKSNWWDAE